MYGHTHPSDANRKYSPPTPQDLKLILEDVSDPVSNLQTEFVVTSRGAYRFDVGTMRARAAVGDRPRLEQALEAYPEECRRDTSCEASLSFFQDRRAIDLFVDRLNRAGVVAAFRENEPRAEEKS